MTWQCPRCFEELGELNGYCEYCKSKDKIIVYNPDKYCIRDVRIFYITSIINTIGTLKRGIDRIDEISESNKINGSSRLNKIGENHMTPQEELFADLFNGYRNKPEVNAMTDLELRAHREDLSKIAFEAKAYIYAVDEILKERKPKGPQGFSHSLNIDENSREAINNIKERQKRLTKSDKIREGLLKLGIDPDEADKIMSAKNILSQVQSNKIQNTSKPEIPEEIRPSEVKPIFNPFEKKL